MAFWIKWGKKERKRLHIQQLKLYNSEVKNTQPKTSIFLHDTYDTSTCIFFKSRNTQCCTLVPLVWNGNPISIIPPFILCQGSLCWKFSQLELKLQMYHTGIVWCINGYYNKTLLQERKTKIHYNITISELSVLQF